MQLNRFVRGTLPLWAVLCFSCGGSTSSVGGLVPDRRGEEPVRSPAPPARPAPAAPPSAERRRARNGRRRRRQPARLRRHLRPGEPPDLFVRHQRRPDGRPERRVPQPHRARERRRLRRLSPDHLSPQRRDGHQRRHQAARPVVLGSDRHARRRPRQDAVRRVVRPGRPEGLVPRRQQAGLRHAARRLDVHARSGRPGVAAAGRDHGPLLGQRAPQHQRRLLRPLRARAGRGERNGERVLPVQPGRRSLERGPSRRRPTPPARTSRASSSSRARTISPR